MLVSAAKMLKDAKAGKYAVGHFNINNLEWTKAILLTAQELNSPVILGVSEGAGKYMCGFKTVTAMVAFLRPLSELSIARKFARIKKYDAVFTSCNKAFR
ncbi:MAG: class II fructose-bisphosphate aldolase, partial [Ruminococcus sp.]|nr:class II fructose-bisphosphate aldolase [Ruminococcus sp.]